MIETIIIALFTYIATSLDEIPMLYLLYSKDTNKDKHKSITLAYFIGTILILTVSLFGAFGLLFLPEKWIIGFIGLIPLILGVRLIFEGEDESEEDQARKHAGKFKNIIIQIIAMTILFGSDDLGAYIPLFTTLSAWELFVMIAIFMLGTAVICWLSRQLTRISKLQDLIEKYEQYITGVIFVCIGIIVMIKCGTIEKIISIF